MISQQDIDRIFDELTERYNRISTATIRDIITGKKKVGGNQTQFVLDNTSSPTLNEVENAFLKYTSAIFTAFRGGYTLEENIARNQLLKTDMDKQGLKYRPVMGCYKEADREYTDVEYCYFVTNDKNQRDKVFFSMVYRLSEKYDQDSFLYKRAGINRTAFLVASTDAGRVDLKGDIRFAGQLYLNVADVGAWSQGKDGRFAFQLRGMILIITPNPKIKIGEGNLFDDASYGADGLIMMRRDEQKDLKVRCEEYNGLAPLVQHVFKKDNPSKDYLHDVIFSCLKKILDKKCKKNKKNKENITIGFHCSVTLGNSSVEGATFVYETIKLWTQRFGKKISQIVIVDIYGDYNKVLNDRN